MSKHSNLDNYISLSFSLPGLKKITKKELYEKSSNDLFKSEVLDVLAGAFRGKIHKNSNIYNLEFLDTKSDKHKYFIEFNHIAVDYANFEVIHKHYKMPVIIFSKIKKIWEDLYDVMLKFLEECIFIFGVQAGSTVSGREFKDYQDKKINVESKKLFLHGKCLDFHGGLSKVLRDFSKREIEYITKEIVKLSTFFIGIKGLDEPLYFQMLKSFNIADCAHEINSLYVKETVLENVDYDLLDFEYSREDQPYIRAALLWKYGEYDLAKKYLKAVLTSLQLSLKDEVKITSMLEDMKTELSGKKIFLLPDQQEVYDYISSDDSRISCDDYI